jgi:hypothetical protein
MKFPIGTRVWVLDTNYLAPMVLAIVVEGPKSRTGFIYHTVLTTHGKFWWRTKDEMRKAT